MDRRRTGLIVLIAHLILIAPSEDVHGQRFTDGAYDVAVTEDGRFFVQGRQYHAPYLAHLTPEGRVEWFHERGFVTMNGHAFGRTDEGSLYAFDERYPAGGWIVKYGEDGEVVWEKLPPWGNWSERHHRFVDFDVAANGSGICIATNTSRGEWPDAESVPVFSRVDASGNVVWSHTYPRPAANITSAYAAAFGDACVFSLASYHDTTFETRDGPQTVSASVTEPVTFVVRFGADGLAEWVYTLAVGIRVNSVRASGDAVYLGGSFVLPSVTFPGDPEPVTLAADSTVNIHNSRAFLASIDASGARWATQVGTASGVLGLAAVDGGVLATGLVRGTPHGFFVARFSDVGDHEMYRVEHTAAESWGYGVAQGPNGMIAVAGMARPGLHTFGQNGEVSLDVQPMIKDAYGTNAKGILVAYDESGTPILAIDVVEALMDLGFAPVSTESQPEVESFEVEIYPNPASSSAQLVLTLPHEGRLDIELIDLLGRRVRTIHHGHALRGRTALEMDISELSPGWYLVRVQGNGSEITRRLIVLAE